MKDFCNSISCFSKGLPILFHLCIYWVLDGFIMISKYNISGGKERNELDFIKSIEWFYVCCLILSDVFGIIFQFIFEKKNKNIFQFFLLFQKQNEIADENNDYYEIKDYEKYKYLLFSSLLEFLIRISDLLYMIALTKQIYPLGMIWLFSFDFLFRYISFMFANFKRPTKLDTLTIISLCVISPALIFFFIKFREVYLMDYLFYFVLIGFKIIMGSLKDIINNYLLDEKQVEPSSIMLFRGIFNLIMMIIVTLFMSPFNNLVEYFYCFKNDNSMLKSFIFLFFLLIIIASMNKSYNLLVTVKKFTAIPAAFSYIVEYIIKYIENRIDSDEDFDLNEKDMINIVYIVITFSIILIYSNIIQINSLESNVNKNIEMEDYENEWIENYGVKNKEEHKKNNEYDQSNIYAGNILKNNNFKKRGIEVDNNDNNGIKPIDVFNFE